MTLTERGWKVMDKLISFLAPETHSQFYAPYTDAEGNKHLANNSDMNQYIPESTHESELNHYGGIGEQPDPEPEPEPHVHVWHRGVLPGQHYIKQCDCGQTEDITLQEWTHL